MWTQEEQDQERQAATAAPRNLSEVRLMATKKELEDKALDLELQANEMVKAYNALQVDAQTKLDQLSAMNRRQQLMITLLETFANEVLTSTRKLQDNVAQTNATLQEAEDKITNEDEK